MAYVCNTLSSIIVMTFNIPLKQIRHLGLAV